MIHIEYLTVNAYNTDSTDCIPTSTYRPEHECIGTARQKTLLDSSKIQEDHELSRYSRHPANSEFMLVCEVMHPVIIFTLKLYLIHPRFRCRSQFESQVCELHLEVSVPVRVAV